MKYYKLFQLLPIAIVLAGCATSGGSTSPGEAAAKAVYTVQGTYNIALTVAVAYKALPPCGFATSPILCSDAAIVGKLQKADNVAFPALIAAQNTVRLDGVGTNAATAIAAANQAVAAFAAITATLATK